MRAARRAADHRESRDNEQKVFASFFKKKAFSLFFFEKKNQKTFTPLAFCGTMGIRLIFAVNEIPNAISLAAPHPALATTPEHD